MIKLSINPNSENKISKTFDKSTIIIGLEEGNHVDLSLNKESLKEHHVKIFFKEAGFQVSNLANDPLTLLNDEPVETKIIQPGDRIKIGSTEILIEELNAEQIENKEEAIDVEEELKKINLLFNSNDEEEGEDDLTSFDIDSLLEEVEKLNSEEIDKLELTAEPTVDESFQETTPPPKKSSIEKSSDTPKEEENPTPPASKEEKPFDDVALHFIEEEDELEFLNDFDETDPEREEIDEEAQPLQEAKEPQQTPENKPAEKTTPPPAQKKEKAPQPRSSFFSKDEDINQKLLNKREISEQEEAIEEGDEVEFDDDLFEFELLEKEKEKKALSEQKKRKETQKKRLLVAASITLLLVGVISSWFVLSVKENNALQEALAAQGVSDISIAVIHAKIYNDKPENGFWDDSTFLNRNLSKVLPPKYRALSTLNNKANFDKTPYQLKIYSQNNTEDFVVVAIPEPGFTQWLMPKRAVFVDSITMNLQLTNEISNLNQLPSPRITESVPSLTTISMSKKTSKVSLTYLQQTFENGGFDIPHTLAASIPGAHRYLYNAPRYYLLTKEFLKKASLLNQTILTESDLRAVAKLYDSLSRLHKLVFYSSEGRAHAILASKGFSENFENKEMVTGYLTFDLDSGLISSAHLLSSDTLEGRFEDSVVAAEVVGIKMEKSAEAELSNPDVIEKDHPLYKALIELSTQREEQLKIAEEKITNLLRSHTQNASQNIEEFSKNLLKSYFISSQEQSELITNTLIQFYLDLVEKKKIVSTTAFTNVVEEVKLTPFLPQSLIEGSPDLVENLSLQAQLEEDLEAIKEAQDLLELDAKVSKVATLLNKETVKKPELLLSWQNTLRSHVLEKIGDFILSPTTSPNTFQTNHRTVLDRILNLAQISDEEEKSFYLREFDLLVEKYQSFEQLMGVDETIEKEAERLSEKIATIPINEVSITGEEEKRENFGRLGQQILIQKKQQAVSREGDNDLKEAIHLLMQAKDSNRNYWQDILEARLLLTETPKSEITHIFESPLGFKNETENYFVEIRNTLNSYIRALQAISTVKEKQQFQIQYEHLKKTQVSFLTEALEKAQVIQKNCRTLDHSLEQMITRIKNLHYDYLAAKTEGFFVQKRRLHLSNIKKLQSQIASLKKLKESLLPITANMYDSGASYDTIISQELARLNGDQPVTPKDVLALEKEANNIFFPKLTANNISQKITKSMENKVTIF